MSKVQVIENKPKGYARILNCMKNINYESNLGYSEEQLKDIAERCYGDNKERFRETSELNMFVICAGYLPKREEAKQCLSGRVIDLFFPGTETRSR